MHANDLLDRAGGIPHGAQHVDNLRNRGRHSCEQQGGRTASCVIITDFLKRIPRRLHGIAAEAAVNVKIDKSRREIVSLQIDRSIRGSFPNLDDSSVLLDKLKAIADSIRKN